MALTLGQSLQGFAQSSGCQNSSASETPGRIIQIQVAEFWPQNTFDFVGLQPDPRSFCCTNDNTLKITNAENQYEIF